MLHGLAGRTRTRPGDRGERPVCLAHRSDDRVEVPDDVITLTGHRGGHRVDEERTVLGDDLEDRPHGSVPVTVDRRVEDSHCPVPRRPGVHEREEIGQLCVQRRSIELCQVGVREPFEVGPGEVLERRRRIVADLLCPEGDDLVDHRGRRRHQVILRGMGRG